MMIFATGFYFLFLTTIGGVASVGIQCPKPGIYVPSDLGYNQEPSPSTFPFVYSGLQIFSDLTIPCSGLLKTWKFIARHPRANGLNLAVFRLRIEAVAELVGATYVNGQLPGVNRTNTPAWVTYNAKPPIPVQAGDVLGFYYNKFSSPSRSRRLTIPVRQPAENILDDSITPLSTIFLEIDGEAANRTGLVYYGNATRVTRIPALAAVIDPPQQAQTGTTDYLPEYCIAGQLSDVPEYFTAEPLEHYSIFESGLQIFTRMRIPCTGYLTRWRIGTKRSIVKGLHLGVFHPVNEDEMRLVGENAVQLIPQGDWIVVEANPVIAVSQGDFIGIFYDNYATSEAAIACRDSSAATPEDGSSLTYAFHQLDSSTLKINAKVNIHSAVRAARVPALAAVLEYIKDPPPNLQDKCSESGIFLPPEFEPTLPSPSKFSVEDAGLQVFTYMEVPCKGLLTEWKFVINHINGVNGLHLCIFRPREFSTKIDFVGETVVVNAELSKGSTKPTWISRPAEPSIPVQPGDFIGVYYDDIVRSSARRAIPSERLFENWKETPPTLVYLMNSTELSKLKGTIDSKDAMRDSRRIALVAVVQGSFSSSTTVEEMTTTTILDTTRTKRVTIAESIFTFPISRRSTTSTTTNPAPKFTTLEPIRLQEPVMIPFWATLRLVLTTPRPWLTAIQWQPAELEQTTWLQNSRCSLQPSVPSDCSRRNLRFYYDFFAGICRSVVGCPDLYPGANNFDTPAECNLACVRQSEKRHAECFLIPGAPIMCPRPSTRYYYMSRTTECAPFLGCPSISSYENNFASFDECASKCQAVNHTRSTVVEDGTNLN